MRWSRGERSTDIEDRRGESEGGGPRIRLGGGAGLGIGGVLIVLVLSLVFGQNFFSILGDSAPIPGNPGPSAPTRPAPRSAAEEALVDFVSFVLDDVQDTWVSEFQRLGRDYQRARRVLFTDAVRSGCGAAESAMGPFYCPEDRKVYIDLGFYQELKRRFGAPGDFAQAYVLAHEIGHHVQTLLGIAAKVRDAQRASPDRAAALSVRMELQADCLAGVWASSTAHRDLLEAGDVEEGMSAAAPVGDDRIQRQTTGRVTPGTWTHGLSSQRVAAFKRGFTSGRLQDCEFRGGARVDGVRQHDEGHRDDRRDPRVGPPGRDAARNASVLGASTG